MNKVLTAPRKPTVIPNLEVYQKLQKLRRLSDAIVATGLVSPQTAHSIQQRQNLINQRKALKATLPPIRLVASNPDKPITVLKPTDTEPDGPDKEPDDCA